MALNGTVKKAAKKPGSWSDQPDRKARDAEHLNAMEEASRTPPKATKTTKAKESPVTKGPRIELPRLQIERVKIRIVGDSELIVHHWSEKAIKEMLDKQMGVATVGREPKVPENEYRDSLYPYPGGGYGFPSIAFKGAAVEACTSLGRQAVTKVAARQAFHLIGEMVKIEGTPRMRQDMVRLNGGTADIRFRGGFPEWQCWLNIRYNARVLTADQIVNLFNTAGFAVGVGEWRSERDGSFGLFHAEEVVTVGSNLKGGRR